MMSLSLLGKLKKKYKKIKQKLLKNREVVTAKRYSSRKKRDIIVIKW